MKSNPLGFIGVLRLAGGASAPLPPAAATAAIEVRAREGAPPL